MVIGPLFGLRLLRDFVQQETKEKQQISFGTKSKSWIEPELGTRPQKKKKKRKE